MSLTIFPRCSTEKGNNMTDNEIIKALEQSSNYDCELCEVKDEDCQYLCEGFMADSILDLIKRQNAEIESLKKRLDMSRKISLRRREHNIHICDLSLKLLSLTKTAESEAIKEFARIIENRVRELQQYYCKLPHERTNHGYLVDDILATIYSVTKEMTEGEK